VESLPGSQRGDTGHGASGGFGPPPSLTTTSTTSTTKD
jgi:hypothetical protein